ncbi:BLUF domain-containing protein [Nocardioides sp. 503]|uniref:BLUF domain-containing protein n=1 Tax=Nocardioides sp. 503 TaxID=2508326 RepID=UPI00106F8DC4|nr:BLUF domain-containing protein [Nocardioides sp. 503]
MLSITYVSTADRLLTKPELLSMLAAIRPRNEALGLSGMLLYRGGNIIQTIEGPDEVVDATYAKIEKDARHKGVLLLLRDPVEERLFPDWSMGFHEVSAGDLAEVDGYTEFLRRPATASLGDRAAPAYRLLELFRENMR